MHAKNATKTADGIVVVCDPVFWLTNSGPHTALTATATHIIEIASEPHTSRTRRNSAH
jgi:hypothetical protein